MIPLSQLKKLMEFMYLTWGHRVGDRAGREVHDDDRYLQYNCTQWPLP